MRFSFTEKELESLFVTGTSRLRLSPEIVKQFMKVMQTIASAHDQRDLAAIKGRRFEKLHRGDYSMRLNDQYRITFQVEGDEAIISAIEDYH